MSRPGRAPVPRVARWCRVWLGLCLMAVAGAVTAAVSETTHGAWTVRCEEPADGVRQCIMLQNLVLIGGGQPVLQFSIGLAPADATPTVLISLPLGISLPPGISIRIDAGKTATFPVERCEPVGCQAGMRLRPATVEQLRAGEQLEITFYDGERQPILVPLPLTGFSAAFEQLSGTTTATSVAPQ